MDETIRFVTCNYCAAKLEVVHGESVTHTRQLDRIERTTNLLASNLKVIELQNEIERLDREWDRDREGMLVRDASGRVREWNPTGEGCGCLVIMAIGVVFMLIAGGLLSSMPDSGGRSTIPVVGVVILIISGISRIVYLISKSDRFRARKWEYETRRAELVAQLEAERRE